MNGIPKIDFSQNYMTFGVSLPKTKTKVIKSLPQKVEEGYNILRKYLVEADNDIIECEREIAETYPLNPNSRKLHEKLSILKNHRGSIVKQMNAVKRTNTFIPQYLSDLVAKTSQSLRKLDEFHSKRFGI